MKSRFTTIDIAAVITEITTKYLGMRVANVYDIDNKTYLIKLQKPDSKAMILLESGIRIHSTEFNWPKNMMPSGFSMKLRKHLRTRRLESIQQLGADRIIDLQFGSNEAAYHIIIELYDRGNMVLTDHEYTILNILRARTDDSQDVRFAVRETYPLELARQNEGVINQERLMAILLNAKEGDNLKRTLNPHLEYGPALIEHVLLSVDIAANASINKGFSISEDMPKLMVAMSNAEEILQSVKSKSSKGYIIQKKEKKPVLKPGEESEELLTYQEFHPLLFKQHEQLLFVEMESFDHCVDEFFSQIGSQKLDMKALQQEKSALKKLENVKKDHEKRITALQSEQDSDTLKAQLIEINLTLVDRAIVVVNTALANQVDWQDIESLVKEAQSLADHVATAIKSLKLDSNHITMLLKDPYMYEADEDEEDSFIKPMKVDIDLSLSAYANARKYYDMKRHAVVKEQKTIEASGKALKSAERKTKETLKEMKTVASINKARKTHWFEKFLWFVTSENYVVIGGRDQQQNEIIVKKYMKPGDLYVHADLHGASSCVIKNPRPEEPISPKSLNEAGTMALCNSAAWDARVVTSAWWVHSHQVSKTAPTGEYLTTGSFMIRGKKNYLPPSYLIYGFGFLFKLDETSIFRHKAERRIKTLEEDEKSQAESIESDITDDTESDITADNDETDSDDNSDDEESANDDIETVTNKYSSESNANENKTSDSKLNVTESEMLPDELSVKKQQTQDSNSESDEEESLFPDTSLELHHVKGDKFCLQRGERSLSGSSQNSTNNESDFQSQNPVEIIQKSSGRLSAKQRRELKKPHKVPVEDSKELQDTAKDKTKTKPIEPSDVSNPPVVKQHPAKRGQKTKLKKIKEKYAEQDEEDRTLMMEMLGSAGEPKEDKKKNKKKNKQKEAQRLRNENKEVVSKQSAGNAMLKKGGKLTLEDIQVNTLSIEDKLLTPAVVKKMEDGNDGEDSDEEKQAILDDENIRITEDADILDSLTGIPVADDLLLFAIPVCAPYSCLVNYKYKVKLLPGNTKRGKAAKTALNMFQHDKSATQREKDLFKSLKDVDLSRNMPGKVKVSAPNIQKSKKR